MEGKEKKEEKIEEIIKKLNEKFDVRRMPQRISLGTLGKIEWEMAGSLLLRLFKEEGRIAPVTPQKLTEMIKRDKEKYIKCREEANRRFEEMIRKMGVFKRFLFRIQQKLIPSQEITVQVLSPVFYSEYHWKGKPLPRKYAMEYQRIQREVAQEMQLSFNPVIEFPFLNILSAYKEMEEEGLLRIEETEQGEVLIPSERFFKAALQEV